MNNADYLATAKKHISEITFWSNLIKDASDNEFVKVVRCRDCKHYYEVDNYHPQGNYISRCCKYFDTYNDEVEPDGFSKWGERR